MAVAAIMPVFPAWAYTGAIEGPITDVRPSLQSLEAEVCRVQHKSGTMFLDSYPAIRYTRVPPSSALRAQLRLAFVPVRVIIFLLLPLGLFESPRAVKKNVLLLVCRKLALVSFLAPRRII